MGMLNMWNEQRGEGGNGNTNEDAYAHMLGLETDAAHGAKLEINKE